MNTSNLYARADQFGSVRFWPHLWLLVGAADLPQALREHPWVAWRERAGLIHACPPACTPRQLRERVAQLLKQHPNRHIHVLGIDLPADTWAKTISCAPDSRSARRVSIGFGSSADADAAGLESLLVPEPEASQWLNAQGLEMLPQPLGIDDSALMQDWTELMRVWVSQCKDELSDEDMAYVVGLYGPELPAAVELPPVDAGVEFSAANEDLPMAFAADGLKKWRRWAPISFLIDQTQSWKLFLAVEPGDAAADDDTMQRLLITFSSQQVGKQVQQVEFYDDHPLPVVLRANPAGQFQLDLAGKPELQQRIFDWWDKPPTAGVWRKAS